MPQEQNTSPGRASDVAAEIPHPGRGNRAERWLVVAAWALVVWFYWFTARTSGDWRADAPFDYYNELVAGFRSGQLHLPVQPDPRLVALADPYDPARNSDLRLPDATYFRGKYYLYFGPVPALLLLWPYQALTGEVLPQAAAVWVFCVVGFTAGSALWLRFRRRHFAASAVWLAPTGMLLFGFGTHVLALLRRPQVWETPLAAGFALVMLALLALGRALEARRPAIFLALASLALGLAVGARPPALLAGVAVLPVLWYLFRRTESTRGRGRLLLALILPAASVGAALAWYNYARFGSPWEFGQTYQLTSVRESEMRHFGLGYVAHNLRLYYTWGVEWTRTWPFIASRPFPPGPPGYYGGEELYGLLWFFPVLWFAPAGIWQSWRQRASASGALLLALAAAYTVMGAFTLCFFSATERYQVDFVPALMLLALAGVLVVEERWHGRRWAVRLVIAAPAAVTVLFGVLISFDYHGRSMRATDPVAWRAIAGPVDRVVNWLTSEAVTLTGRSLVVVPGAAPQPEVLAAFGSGERAERWWIWRIGETSVRLGWSSGRGGVVWSEGIALDAARQVRIEFYSPALATGARPRDARHEFWRRTAVVAHAHGRTVLAQLAGEMRAGDPPAEARLFSGRVLSETPTDIEALAVFAPQALEGADLAGSELHLRVALPVEPVEQAQPLLVWGSRGAADVVGIRGVGQDEWELVFDHWGAPPITGTRWRAKPGEVVAMTVHLPGAKGEVGFLRVWIGTREVLVAAGPHYGFPAGQLTIGRNEIGATTVGPEFTGWIGRQRRADP